MSKLRSAKRRRAAKERRVPAYDLDLRPFFAALEKHGGEPLLGAHVLVVGRSKIMRYSFATSSTNLPMMNAFTAIIDDCTADKLREMQGKK